MLRWHMNPEPVSGLLLAQRINPYKQNKSSKDNQT